jgi:diguanylate cyclase (GGDEF)-like protein
MERIAPGDVVRVPHLVALTGATVGVAYRLTKPETLVGREDADFCVSHPSVSRRHARLRIDDDRVVVEDLGSTNGTFVGIDRVEGPTVAVDGDNIAFGIEARFRLTYVPAAEQADKDRPPSQATRSDFSREFLIGLLRVEYAYARRHGSPLTLVFFRSDAVANFAPSHSGEALSEESLSRVATAIDVTIRTEDFLARSGEDEFAVIVRADADAAFHMAERVWTRIGAHNDFPDRATTWQTITAVVLPISPIKNHPAPQPGPEPEQILASARAAARPSMMATSNRIVRLKPLVI